MKNEMTCENNSSSDDEDIFMQGGIPKPISMYSSAFATAPQVTDLDADDDDDDDDDIALNLDAFTKPRRRGRPSKRARTSANTTASQKQATAKNAAHGTKQKNRSVFDISSGEESDEVVVVESHNDETNMDAHDKSVAASLAQARAVLATQANEEKIAADVQRLAKEQSERVERSRCQEKQRQESERVRKQAEEARLKAAQTAAPVQLKVRSGQNQIKMRIRRSDPVLKMLGPFCKKFDLNLPNAVMQFDGEQVEESDTPDTLELEEGMLIDVITRS
ncbi:unnamed protein product [Chondrus crispus]|uniref:Rad60/SUMO-like domain-containing protein n=1 Tax=Chondrus crispus TaxID=2769 RepID=R7QIH4_CHOCR|nr:unnamed protein product [Chondrus crispus]CDF37220.1 unnamed protein product [Chondrus crispus]|eukprot:XP_005717039.1 unnamed protein product [Chondrus crispus]